LRDNDELTMLLPISSSCLDIGIGVSQEFACAINVRLILR
jgi:hypothetical protein